MNSSLIMRNLKKIMKHDNIKVGDERVSDSVSISMFQHPEIDGYTTKHKQMCDNGTLTSTQIPPTYYVKTQKDISTKCKQWCDSQSECTAFVATAITGKKSSSILCTLKTGDVCTTQQNQYRNDPHSTIYIKKIKGIG